MSRGLARSIQRQARQHQIAVNAAVATALAQPGNRKQGRGAWFKLRLAVLESVYADTKIHYGEFPLGKHRLGQFFYAHWLAQDEAGVAGLVMLANLDGKHCRMSVHPLAGISRHALQRLIQSCGSSDLDVMAALLRPTLIVLINADIAQRLPSAEFRLYTAEGMSAWAWLEGAPVLKTFIRADALDPRHARHLPKSDEPTAKLVANTA